jgi:LPXTG-motif cell wall-anchored protein
MQGTPGVSLLVSGCMFVAALAAPAMLMASEEPVAPATEQPAVGPAAPAAPVTADGATDPQLEPAKAPAKGSAPQGARAAATRTVAMRDNKFNPRNITIAVGDIVQWENQGKVEHNAIGDDDKFRTPTIGPGKTSQHTFSKAGKYPYFCSIHFGMKGKIQVGSSGGGGGGSGGGGDGSGGSGSGAANGTGGTSTPGSSSGSTGSTGSTGSGGSTATGGSASSSSLPATGEDLPWLVAFGYAVLLIGALLRLFVFSRE